MATSFNLVLQLILIISPSLIFYQFISKNIKNAVIFNVFMVVAFFASIFAITQLLSLEGITSFMVVFFIIFSISSYLTLTFLKQKVDLVKSLLLGLALTVLVGLFITVGLGGFGL